VERLENIQRGRDLVVCRTTSCVQDLESEGLVERGGLREGGT
jgi:hypothetical protein